jgi:hypothetical protein
MRAVFSLLGLVLVVAIVGLLAKSQLKQSAKGVDPAVVSGVGGIPAAAASAVDATSVAPRELPKQVEANVNALVEQAAKRTEAEAK